MDWLLQYIGISNVNTLDVSVPKEKVVANIRTRFAQKAMIRELDNIKEIIYHAIFRGEKAAGYCEELHIIEVVLLEPKYVKAIAEAFQQAIPYSKVIIFSSGDKFLFFHGSQFGDSISQYDFSDWVYKEEIMVDFDLGTERQPVAERGKVDLWDLPEEIRELFYEAEWSQYISLRHLIDILKIREIKFKRNYVHSIITELAEADKIEYFADYPFVLWTEANQQYLKRMKRNPKLLSRGSVEDRRFGIDRQFESLMKSEFTTIPEMFELLHESTDCPTDQQEWEWSEIENCNNPYNDDESLHESADCLTDQQEWEWGEIENCNNPYNDDESLHESADCLTDQQEWEWNEIENYNDPYNDDEY